MELYEDSVPSLPSVMAPNTIFTAVLGVCAILKVVSSVSLQRFLYLSYGTGQLWAVRGYICLGGVMT